MNWPQILLVCYFLALVTALLKAVRYALDSKRQGKAFYLIGVPANLALATALAGLAVMTGDDPLWRGYWLRITVRLSFIVWAVLALMFEVSYLRTFLHVRSEREEEENGITE